MKRWIRWMGIGVLGMEMAAQGMPTSPAEAAQAVRGWLQASAEPLGEKLGTAVGAVETVENEFGVVLFHVVALEPEGFVICAADTEVEPILVFAATGRYDNDPNNPLAALIRRDAQGRLERAKTATRKAGNAVAARAATKWEILRNPASVGNSKKGSGLSSVDDPRVDPFIQSTWSQGTVGGVACYNYYTPPYAAGSSSNYVCGCNNTAFGQLMRYYRYPTRGVGTKSFSIQVDGVWTTRSLRGGDGAGGAYNWDWMPLKPSSPSTAERQAIGALCADIGVASGTSYAADGSSAGTYESTLKEVFFFGNARYVSGQSCLMDAVRPNLDARLPVLMSIWCSEGGHAVLCDGYGFNFESAYYHLNLGWGGLKDAWYNLPDVDTDYYAFDTLRGFECNIYTNGTGEILSGRVLDEGVPVTGATVVAVGGGLTNSTVTDARGIFAFARLPSSKNYVLSAQKSGLQFTPVMAATGLSPSWGSETGNRWSNNISSRLSEENPELTLTPLSRAVGTAAGTTTFGVTNLNAETVVYTASESEPWLAITAGASGINGGTIMVSYEANSEPAARTGTVWVAGSPGSTSTVTVVQAGNCWDSGNVDIGGGWRRLAWFGDYVPMGGDGWIWHSKHGFLFVLPSGTPQNVWMFSSDQGWLWTSSAQYPFLYRSAPAAWLWYNGSTNPRWLMNMTAGQWETWP